MFQKPNNLTLIPSDMKASANDLTRIYISPVPNFNQSYFFLNLYSTKYPDKPKVMRRVPKRKSTESSQNINNSIISQYYLPDLFFPSSNLRKNEKIKELASNAANEHFKSKKKKQYTQICQRNTSYRKLSILHNLESHFTSHFILNHKFKILMWGCVGSVEHVSDDEGNESRNGNPLYNIDMVNKKFDELADSDIQSEQSISYILKTMVQENQKAQQLRKSSLISPSLVNSAIQERLLFLDRIFNSIDEMNKFPIIEPINFDLDFNFENEKENISKQIPYIEFSLILSIIMNVENVSLSLRIGSEIRHSLNYLRVLIHQSIDNIKNFHYKSNCPYNLVCDLVSAKFLFITFEIINSLLKTLCLPLNWTFQLVVHFFKEKKICLTDGLDQITSEFAKSIDNGSNYAREILKFRELACIVEMNLFYAMVQEECDKFKSGNPCSTRDLIMIARGYNPYFPLFGINVCFNKKGEIYLKISPIPDNLQHEEHSLFPVFNMFDGIYSLDEESLKTIVY